MAGWRADIDLSRQVSYDEALGYGYVTSAIRQKYNYLMIDELSNNFKYNQDDEPLYIRLQVPKEGNYTVSLTVIGGQEERFLSLFAQRRSCIIKNQKLKPLEERTFEFTVNVSSIIPNGYERAWIDTGIDLTLIGKEVKCKALIVKEASLTPVVFIMGDSTVTDQTAAYPYDPFNSYCGWGQMLPLFLGSNLAVSNHAHSGKTTLSFKKEGHFEVIKKRLRAKDFVMLQFGHNDQKEEELMPYEGYRTLLQEYIHEIRTKDAVPILVTPLSRNLWEPSTGQLKDLLFDYADSCKQLAAEEGVTLIDLHEQSIEWIKREGPAEMMKYFYPEDFTHTNDYGGFEIAKLIGEEIKKTKSVLQPYIHVVPQDEVSEKALKDWINPGIQEYYTLISKWELKNEWVKVI